MRNHRLFGVVIAALLGTSFLHQRPSSPHHHHQQVTGTHVSGTAMQLASAHLAVAPSHPSPATKAGLPIGLVRPTGIEFSRALAQLVPAPTLHPHPAPAASSGESSIGLLRPAGTRYVTQLYAWMAYQSAHSPPAPPASAPKATAPPLPVTAPHRVATPVTPVTPVAPATQPAGGSVSSGVWAGLRQCESGGNYADNTGNGYYGAYQFSLSTWHGLGFSGVPSDAPPAVQDQAAQQLQARSGWGQWPACSRRLRLI